MDVAQGKATLVSLASYNLDFCVEVQRLISRNSFRTYTSSDVIGVELGGAIKNVVAIAAGAAVGLGLGHNAVAALVTRGLAEMTRLCVSLGGEGLTMSGLSGLGDLILTCYGELSRNRDFGIRLGRGEPLSEIQCGRVTVAEGVKTARSAHDLAIRHGVDMPITQRVYEGLYESKSPEEVFRELMDRELKQELEFTVVGRR
jgi:glycerol-3-phosphate dehydrogenase (NAD(P)+)